MADVSELADLIAQELEGFYEETDANMQHLIDDVTNEALAELQNNPNIPKRSGQYKKGFYKKTLAKGKGYKRNAIGNKKYQLTHLLEYGHITRNGKRAKAFPHWKQAEELIEKRMREAIKK